MADQNERENKWQARPPTEKGGKINATRVKLEEPKRAGKMDNHNR